MLKDEIVNLRKQGYSTRVIAEKLGCSKSTASIYSRNVKIEDVDAYNRRVARDKKRSALNASSKNEKRWKDKRDKIAKEAEDEWETLKNDPEFMGFLGIYWGEGNKRNGNNKTSRIGVANSDPDIIRICKKFFDKYDPRYRCRIAIYPDQNKKKLVSFWKEITGVDNIKVWEKDSAGEHRNFDSTHGTCYFHFSNFELYHKIMTWINCWRHQ